MEGGLYGIYGGFGSGKSLGATIMMVDKLAHGELVFSNIKLNKNYIPNPQNYYFFEGFDQFYDVLAFSGLFAMKVNEFNDSQMELGLTPFARSARPRINCFFDEVGIDANASDHKDLDKEYGAELKAYILQVRKLFVSCYFICQRPNNFWKAMREHINYWITYKPIWDSQFFGKYAGSYWLQELDKETFKVICETKQAYDSDGNYYNYDIPQEWSLFKVWWKPKYYKMYDDLYLNKVFDTQFKTKFLYDSGLFANLQKGYIRNQNLLDNKHIYAQYFGIIDAPAKAFEYPKITFGDNPTLWIHIRWTQISTALIRKYYFSEIFRDLVGRASVKSFFGGVPDAGEPAIAAAETGSTENGFVRFPIPIISLRGREERSGAEYGSSPGLSGEDPSESPRGERPTESFS